MIGEIASSFHFSTVFRIRNVKWHGNPPKNGRITVLDAYLENKELILEYFAEMYE